MDTTLLSWIEVDLAAIRHNVSMLAGLVHPSRILAVVKSNAYGHGMRQVSKTVLEGGVIALGVVSIDEALDLRVSGIQAPIIVLGYTHPSRFHEAAEANVSVSLYNFEDLKLIPKNVRVNVHAKIDTGLNRMGVLPQEANGFIHAILTHPNLHLEGVFSHLADAENPQSLLTRLQLDEFSAILKGLEHEEVTVPYTHIAASAAALLFPKSRHTLVRVGIMLYGLWPSEEAYAAMQVSPELKGVRIQPALSWKTRVVQVKSVSQGGLVGYGGSFRAPRDLLTAVLPVGYADGYDRHLSNRAHILIHGTRCPVLGRICMNMTIVDISSLRDVKLGDEATLIGRQEQETVTVDELASLIGTINYEVTTRIPVSIPRVYM